MQLTMRGVLWDPPRVPTYYNFAWVPHTFGGLTPLDPPPPLISHTVQKAYSPILSFLSDI